MLVEVPVRGFTGNEDAESVTFSHTTRVVFEIPCSEFEVVFNLIPKLLFCSVLPPLIDRIVDQLVIRFKEG